MLDYASQATGIRKSEIFRKALQEYYRQVQLRQIAEEAEPDESWEDDRISYSELSSARIATLKTELTSKMRVQKRQMSGRWAAK